MRFSTEVTPGANHAVRSASSRSAQDRTIPFKITLLPCTSTVIRWASVSALRISACSIFCWSADGVTRGLTRIRFVTPLTPVRRRTTRSASCFWYCHSTSPLSVTHPLETVTSTLFDGHESIPLDRADSGRGDVGIGALIGARQSDLNIVSYGLY